MVVRAQGAVRLLSDEPTVDLVVKARTGDASAVEALLERCIPQLTRWAHGRLPPAARGAQDTGDLVQEAVIHVLARLDQFEPRGVGALQAYLRMSVINRIRDEVRKITRRPISTEMPEHLPTSHPSPLQEAIRSESYGRYRRMLAMLTPRERELVIARIELEWTTAEIARHFRYRTDAAARMATLRALRRMTAAGAAPPTPGRPRRGSR
ncbi:MAG: RNA polymerase sigma factor [Vicinamibacterales bacterium]